MPTSDSSVATTAAAAEEDTALLHIWAGLVSIFILLFIAAEYNPANAADSEAAATATATATADVKMQRTDAAVGGFDGAVGGADATSKPKRERSRPGSVKARILILLTT